MFVVIEWLSRLVCPHEHQPPFHTTEPPGSMTVFAAERYLAHKMENKH